MMSHTGISSSDDESDLEEDDVASAFAINLGIRQGEHLSIHKPRSLYRRGKFKFKKSEPNRVNLQVLI